MERDGWLDNGGLEDIFLPFQEYDASKSTLSIQWKTLNEAGQERWRPYRDIDINPVILRIVTINNRINYKVNTF